MISELKNKLAGMVKDKEANKLRTRRQLVLAVTRGDKIEPDDAIATMESVGITGEELESDCEKMERRIGLAKKLAKRPKAEKDLETARADMAALDEEWKRISEAHQEKVHAAGRRHETAVDIINAADDAERELIRTSTGETELADVARCEGELAELMAERNRIEKELTNAKGRLNEPQRRLNQTSTSDSAGQQHFSDQIEAIHSTIQRLNGELNQLAPQIEAKTAEVVEARKQLLKPECI